jgi:hypothetical protein
MGSYLAVIESVLDWVRKARALARCPPPMPELQLGKLEAQLARLVNEGRRSWRARLSLLVLLPLPRHRNPKSREWEV